MSQIDVSKKGFPEGNLIVVYDSYNTVSIYNIPVHKMSQEDDFEPFLNDHQEQEESFQTANFTPFYNSTATS